MNRPQRRETPTLSAHPPYLATAAQLEADGRKPAQGPHPTVLFKQKSRDHESMRGLYEGAQAVSFPAAAVRMAQAAPLDQHIAPPRLSPDMTARG